MIKLQHGLACGVAAVLMAGSLVGCAPLLVGGVVVGGSMLMTDRRTTGAQIEDESIESKAKTRVHALATLGQISITSYNRTALVTGQVPGENEKAQVTKAVSGVENLRTVVNELTVGPNASLSSRSNDAVVLTKVKASMVDAKDLQANTFKVVVDRGVVYLMGRVTEREATRGTNLARSVPGVQKVVRVFEILTEEELAALGTSHAPAAPAASAPVAAPAAAASAVQ